MIEKVVKKHNKRKVREKWASFMGFASAQTHKEQHNEIAYLEALSEFKRCHHIDIPLYPFGAAANSSLLYVVARALSTYDVKEVLELGCGQTSYLIDAVKKQLQRNFNVTSLEENKFWQTQVQSQVDYAITHSSLQDQNICERQVSFYSNLDSLNGKKFDFIIVDGPIGKPTYSRFGSLCFLEEHLSEEFIVVFDDCHRRGELQTVEAAIALLKKKNINFKVALIEGLKHQVILASPKYEGACFF